MIWHTRVIHSSNHRSCSSKNSHLFNFPTKDNHQNSRPWNTSTKSTLTRHLSSVESSKPNKILTETIINSVTDQNNHDNPYQRSISIENASLDEYHKRTNRAVSVEPNFVSGGNEMKYNFQQKTLPSRSIIQYDINTKMNKQFTVSSETIDQST